MNELNEFSQDALLDEDNVDEDKKRADAIKFRAEMVRLFISDTIFNFSIVFFYKLMMIP